MINYGIKKDLDGMFYNIFPSVLQVKMCGYDLDEIWTLKFEEDVNGKYWAFQDTGEDIFNMIYPHKVLFDICFLYGPNVEVEAGKGRIVRLKLIGAVLLNSIPEKRNQREDK